MSKVRSPRKKKSEFLRAMEWLLAEARYDYAKLASFQVDPPNRTGIKSGVARVGLISDVVMSHISTYGSLILDIESIIDTPALHCNDIGRALTFALLRTRERARTAVQNRAYEIVAGKIMRDLGLYEAADAVDHGSSDHKLH